MKRLKFRNIFNLKSKSTPNSTACNLPFSGFYDYLMAQGEYGLAASVVFSYYNKCAPLATSIDYLSEESSAVVPVVKDLSSGEFLPTDKPNELTPLIELLNTPNAFDKGKHLFLLKIISTYLLTGNVYIVATALSENDEPRGLYVYTPNVVTIQNDKMGYPEYYQINLTQGADENNQDLKFIRNEDFNKSNPLQNKFARFYTADGTKEIYHIKGYNPFFNNAMNIGVSKASSIYYEIEQYIESSIHNLSVLRQGGKLSGMLLLQGMHTQEEIDSLEVQLHNFYSGAANAGKQIILSGGEMDYKELGKTNRDMDFQKLKKDVTETIYKRFKIPIAMLNNEEAKFSNMSIGKAMLYENAVLPLVKLIYDELTRFLSYRYTKDVNLVLSYDVRSIPALANERLDMAIKMTASSIYTPNETRNFTGYKDFDEGADDIYLDSNKVPISSASLSPEEKEKRINDNINRFKQLMQSDDNRTNY